MIHDKPIAVRVRETALLSPTLKRVWLEAADGGLLPPASPGAHVLVRLKGGERQWRNAYSLVSPPGTRSVYEIIVRRVAASRGGSHHVHDQIQVGDAIEVAAPANLFPIVVSARKHLLIGGGVGVTPLLSFLPELRRMGARFEMHQIAAEAEAAVFEALLAPHGGTEVQVHAGRGGLDLDGLMAGQPLGTHLYVCGPTPLIDAAARAAAAAGWPAGALHRESFGGAAGGAPFVATLARSRLEIRVGADESLLEALEAAGVEAAHLCRGGACGQCATVVLDGVPDHHDHVLTPDEKASNSVMMTCVSRAKTPRLVLDL